MTCFRNALARTALTLVAIALGTGTARAQLGEVKPVYADYTYFPESTVEAGEGSDAQVSFGQLRAGVTVPVVLGDGDTVLLPGLRYGMLDVMVRGWSGPPVTVPQELHSLQLNAGIFQRFSNAWSIYAAVGGGLASDLSGDLSGDDWVVTAQLIPMWTISSEFTLGAGIGYDRRTGDVSPLPLLAIDWQPTEQLMLRGVVPASLAFRYRPIRFMSFGIEGALEGERYHLNAEKYEQEDAEIATSVTKVGLSVTAHWTEALHTRLTGGAALRRRFEVLIDDATTADLAADTGAFFGVALWFGESGFRGDAAPVSPLPENRHAAGSAAEPK